MVIFSIVGIILVIILITILISLSEIKEEEKLIEENYKCSQCGKDIVWIFYSKSERDREISSPKHPNKVCKDCYENFMSGKWKP